MKRYALLSFCFLSFTLAFSQEAPKEVSKEYRATPEKINDLVHTRLDARFDYSKSQLNGKVWITLKPHFYATDSLALDAKAMDIKSVSIVKGTKNSPLKYTYNGWVLNIRLDKTYKGGEPYTVYIDYTAKPNELQAKAVLLSQMPRDCILSTHWVKKKTSLHRSGHKEKLRQHLYGYLPLTSRTKRPLTRS